MKLKAGGKAVIILALVSALGFGLYKTDFDKKIVAASTGGKTSSAISAPKLDSIGTARNPLKVSLVSFHGYAPALVANGKNLVTQPDSIYDHHNLNVKFVIQDDVPTLATIFESGAAHCAWRTSDFWAQEQPNLRNAGLDGRAVMIVDNTRGGDAIIARDPSIRSVEDLADKSVALLQFTPSHGLTIDAIDNSSLTSKKKASVKYVYINAEEGTGGVRAAFEAGKVDAAVLWDPDLSLAVKNGGGHVVYSTKSASNLIFDVMVCDSRVLKDADGRQAIEKFVNGWMEGVTVAQRNPDAAVEALVNTEELFALLQKTEGSGFIKSLFTNVVWTDVSENARILGMVGGTNHYERVYQQFDGVYRKAGALANPNSPVIAPQDSFDYSFMRNMVANAGNSIHENKASFTASGLSNAARGTAAVTKPVTVSFNTGSAELTQKSKKIIDTEMVPFIENNGSAYIEISGNTDSIGSRDANMSLSRARAKVVTDYLVSEWEMSRSRFSVVGNGPDHPICRENADGTPIDECRALNRSTRVSVLGK